MHHLDDSILTIDLNRLEEECANQPKLFFKWASQLSDARQLVDEAKNEMEVTKADLNLAIRANPSKFGIEKSTEKSIDAAVLSHSQYEGAFNKHLQAKHKLDIVQAMVTAFDQRKRMLEKEVDLHGQKYFAKPYVPSETQESIDDLNKASARRKTKKKRRRDRA